MKNTASDRDRREPHALDLVTIRKDTASWQEKLAEWQKPMTFEDRLSWLHVNQEREGNGPERFVFFLELADRYGEKDTFAPLARHDKHINTARSFLSIAELKSRLSKKAFAIVCNTFFNKDKPPCPIYLPYQDPLFSKLLWFFRPFGGYGGWDNLRPYNKEGLAKDGGSYYVITANDYAEEFVLDAWQILNHHWFKCWDCPNPDPKVAEPRWREIVILMRHLDMLKHIEDGQYIPIPTVFRKMVGMVLEEHAVAFDEKSLEDTFFVGRLLEPLTKKGDRLAHSLYIARLNVDDHDHSRDKI